MNYNQAFACSVEKRRFHANRVAMTQKRNNIHTAPI